MSVIVKLKKGVEENYEEAKFNATIYSYCFYKKSGDKDPSLVAHNSTIEYIRFE